MTVPDPNRDSSINTGAHVAGDVNTDGGDFIGRDRNVFGDEVHGDKVTGVKIGHAGGSITVVQNGDYVTHNYTGSDPAQPIRTLADPLCQDARPILVCRRTQVQELDACLQAACYGGSSQAHHLVVVTGNREAGKRDLLRTWLEGVRRRPDAPLVAVAPFLPPSIPESAQAAFYRTHPAWQLDWTRYGEQIARYFPPLFTLGSYPWIVLAAQLAGQSERVRRLVADPGALPGLASLQSEQALDPETLRLTLAAVLRAAASERPLMVILEHVQQAEITWLIWLKFWLEDMANLRVLFVAVADTPFPLHDRRLQRVDDQWLQWLQAQTVPSNPRAYLLQVGRLTRGEIEEMLVPAMQEWALDLHYLSEGSPVVLRELLAHWRNEGKAEQAEDGRWLLHFDPLREAPGSLGMRFVEEPLKQCVRRAQACGYEITYDELRNWLRLAAWEGDYFTDEALAYALDRHDDDQLEAFQELLDEALCLNEQEQGVLEELDGSIRLATSELNRPFHYMAGYRIVPPVLGRVLLNSQGEQDRHEGGLRYAQALIAAYASWTERIAPRLVEIYEAIGDLSAAQAMRTAYFVPQAIDKALLSSLCALVVTTEEKRMLLQRLVSNYDRLHLRVHVHQLVPILEAAQTIAQELHDLPALAVIVNRLGFACGQMGEQRHALAKHKRALRITRQVGDKGGEANTLTLIGRVYSDLGDQQQALAYYEQALPLTRKVEDRGGEAATRFNIGLAYSALGDQQQALAYYEQALPLAREIGDKNGVATILVNIGRVYSALGDEQQALAYYEQALPLMRQIGDKRGEAATLNSIGLVYSVLGDEQQALAYYEQALPLVRQIGDKHGEATTLTNIGRVYSALGDQEQALAYFEQALPLMRQVEDKRGEASTLNNIGEVFSALGDQQQALAYFEQALPLLQQVEDKGGESAILVNIGRVYSALGDQEQALAYYEQALPLTRRVRDERGEASTLNNIGLVYFNLGDQQHALAYYQQALPLMRQLCDKGGEASTLNNIGMVYSNLGDQQHALAYYEQALPLMRQVCNKGSEAATLNNIGAVYSRLGDKQQALAYFEQALRLIRQRGDKGGESVTRFNIAMVARALGDLDRAVAEMETVVALDEALHSRNLGRTHSMLGQLRKLRGERS